MDEYIPSGKRPAPGKKKASGKPKGKKEAPAPEKNIGAEQRRQAIALYKKAQTPKDFKAVASLLLPYTDECPEDLTALKLLGFCYTVLEDYESAERLFLSVTRENDSDTEALNALAYCAIAKNNLEEATHHLLDALYLEPNQPLLKENLERIRKISDHKVFLLKNPAVGFITITIPREKGISGIQNSFGSLMQRRWAKWGILGISAAILGLILYITYPALSTWADNYRFKRGLGRGRVTHVSIQDIDRIVAERAVYQIKLSEDDIKRKFSMVQTYIEEKQPNRAMILVNELLNSNADDRIKERVIFLRDFIQEPSPDEIDYNPPVQEVIKTPFLYQNVVVRWSGMLANLEHKERKETVFELLINFVQEAVVEGIAEVHFHGFQKVVSGQKIAIVGKISGISLDNKVIVIGKEIQQLGR